MRTQLTLIFFAAALVAGCSAKDPPTTTPTFKFGVPNNRSTVTSDELNREPFYTQPGVNGGKPVVLKPIPSQRGFEPNDPVAEAVYQALQADGTVPTRYITTSAKDGVVILTGTVDTPAGKAAADQIARRTPGVRQVRNTLRILQTHTP